MSALPRLLVSLLVGQADDERNRLSTLVAVSSFLASDAAALFTLDLHALINGGAPTLPLCDELRAHGFDVHVVSSNIGIGEGRNLTMRRALEVAPTLVPDFYLELHNDFVFPSVWAAPLLDAFATNPRLALLGVTIFTSRGYFGSDALALDLATPDWQSLVGRVEEAKVRAVSRYASTPAHRRIRRGITCPWLGRWTALADPRAHGPYYPDAFGWQEYEDTDLVRRLEDAGYRVGVTVDSFAYHHYLWSRLKLRESLPDPKRRASSSRVAFYARYPDATTWKAQFDADCERMLEP